MAKRAAWCAGAALWLVAAIAPAAGTMAETPGASTVAGAWKFKTDNLPKNGCIITGDMTIAKTSTPNVWSCEFTSREDCGVKPNTRFQRVKQSCRAITIGRTVEITSKVEAIIDAGPPELRADLMAPGRYKADDFSVTLQPSGDEMIGRFHSLQVAGVRFWRIRDLTS